MLLGTAEVIARVLPRAPIAPGGRGLARLALEGRRWSRAAAIGSSSGASARSGPSAGAWCWIPLPPLRQSRVARRSRSGGHGSAGWRRWWSGGRRVSQPQLLPVLLGLAPAAARAVAAGAPDASAGGRALGDRGVADSGQLDAALELLRRYHREQPLERGMPLETLRRVASGSGAGGRSRPGRPGAQPGGCAARGAGGARRLRAAGGGR